MKKHIIDPIMQDFIDKINNQGGTPIYELSPCDARKVLLDVQDIPISLLNVNIEDKVIQGGPKSNVSIRILRPENNKSKLPVVMFFHGGGWILGDNKTHNRLVREIVNGSQAAVVFVNYTPSPEAQYPISIEEAYFATKYIYENGENLNLDTSKLVLMGDSVGGNMATAVAILAKERGDPKINYQILLYPVTDSNFETDSYNEFSEGYWLTKKAMKWFWDAYLPDKQKRNEYLASPLKASIDQLRGLPPTLIITNENDVLRDEGEAYVKKLMEADVKVTGIRLLGSIHDSMMLNAVTDTPVIRDAIEFVNIKLRQVFEK